MTTTIIVAIVAVVVALLIAVPVTCKVAVNNKIQKDAEIVGTAEDKARINDEKIDFYKKIGKISAYKTGDHQFKPSNLAIGHSRWATHGGVTEANAHPHFNTEKTLAVVHNGIIENYREIKADLESKGYVFVSQTDTESIVHLIDFHIQLFFSIKVLENVFLEYF